MSQEKEHPLKKKVTPPTEAELVEDWRREEFTRILGPTITYDDVTDLVKSDADLREAEKLSKQGCPPDLIVKILAPLAA